MSSRQLDAYLLRRWRGTKSWWLLAIHDVNLLMFIVEQNLVGINAEASSVTLSPLRIHMTHHRARCVKTWRHPQNRKYITYRNAVGKGRQQIQKFSEIWLCGFWRMRSNQQTDRQTKKTRYSSQYFAPSLGPRDKHIEKLLFHYHKMSLVAYWRPSCSVLQRSSCSFCTLVRHVKY